MVPSQLLIYRRIKWDNEIGAIHLVPRSSVSTRGRGGNDEGYDRPPHARGLHQHRAKEREGLAVVANSMILGAVGLAQSTRAYGQRSIQTRRLDHRGKALENSRRTTRAVEGSLPGGFTESEKSKIGRRCGVGCDLRERRTNTKS